MRRHLYVIGLKNNPVCRKRGITEVNSVKILCAREALSSFRYSYLGSFFLEPEGVRKQSIGVIWNFGKGTGLL